jgi:hypothetical protein
VNKQELEEARQLAMSMTSHPLAFGTIDHVERAGELLGLLCVSLDQKHAEYEDLKACTANNARNLAREAHTWSKATETYAASEAKLVEALTDLLAAHAMRASCQAGMVERCKCVPCATTRAREALGPNDKGNRPA